MIGTRWNATITAAIFATTLILGACDGRQPEPMDDVPTDMPMQDMPTERMQQGMPMDPEMMERHADEADAMAAQMHDHIQSMRQLSPEEQHARMPEHANQVSQMLSLMDRHMDEMSQGMPMDDEHMGAMMGMSAQEHRDMMDQMQGLRSELEDLQTGSPSDVQGRMSQHLDRCDALVETMEQSAQQMRPPLYP